MISKLGFVGAVALSTVSAVKDSNFAGRTIDNLMTYAGFSSGLVPPSEHDATQFAAEGETPQLNSIGWSTSKWSSSNSYRGYAVYLNQDLGFSWQFPLYNQDTYLVWRQRLHMYLGGRNYIQLGTGFAMLTLYLDVWGARLTMLDNYMRYDVVNYGDFCQAADWYLQFATIQSFMQIDVNQCIYGLIGWQSSSSSTSDCSWATYYINYPLTNMNFYNETRGGTLMASTCGDPIPPYDTVEIVG